MADARPIATVPPPTQPTQLDIDNFRGAFNSLLTHVFIIINNCSKETKENETSNQNELISNFSRQLSTCHDMVDQMEGLDTTPRELEDNISLVKRQIEQRIEVIKQCRDEGLFIP